ncbi:MAG: AbiV family abortive infection protein, partial [Pseudomonadota bacterium]
MLGYSLAKDGYLANSLATLSIEESGKVSILRAMSLARDEKELKEEWRRYRSHTNKNVQWILP